MTHSTSETELIHTLYDNLKERTALHIRALRLDTASKLSSIFATLLLSVIFLHLFTALLIFLTFQGAYYLASLFGSLPLAILLIILIYIVMLVALYTNRKRWLLLPITRCMLHMFDLKKEATSEKPLATITQERLSLNAQLENNKEALQKHLNAFITPTPPSSPIERFAHYLNWGSYLIKGIKMGYKFIKNKQESAANPH